MLGRMDIAARLIGQRPTTRRRFLQVSGLAGAGFLIGCQSGEETAETTDTVAAPEAAAETSVADLNAFVRVGSDDTVTVVVKHLDKGQGITTGLATIVAEELGAGWSQMRSEFAPADVEKYANLAFGVQGTGGSTSIANSWMQLRTAAAGARAMLVAAAADDWGVAPGEVTLSGGVLRHDASGKQAPLGDFAAAAADVSPPAEPALKDPSEFTLIGTHVPRLDSAAKTDGSQAFTADLTRPGMLLAVVRHPPKFGATVKSVDASAAMTVKGVKEVVQIPRGVAVLADSYWSASKGRDALRVEWNLDGAESRSSEKMFADYREALAGQGLSARGEGDADGVLAESGASRSASFEFPFLAHATMEPMNCLVELGADGCEVWTGSQLQTVDQQVVAAIVGMTPEQVRIHTQYAGGSFGRRAVPDSDFVAETAMIAKAIDGRAPVKLQWSREDDMRAGRYRPMSVHSMEAKVDDAGDIVAWRHRIASQSFLVNTPFEGLIQDGIDASMVEGARELPYGIPNLGVEAHTVDSGVPGLWWRSVGHTHNAYATEVFFDMLAHDAGKDPLALRLELLKEHPRHTATLNLVAEKSGWGTPLPEGRGRGVAVHESFGSVVAEVAEVTVAADGGFTVDRVVCAVECGIAVNPDVVRAQMEGGIGYGLSAMLREAVTLADGEVTQGNFHEYRPLRINEMPRIEVHIVPSAQPPSGVGEPGTPPAAPAVANALFAASGRWITTLPVGDQLKA